MELLGISKGGVNFDFPSGGDLTPPTVTMLADGEPASGTLTPGADLSARLPETWAGLVHVLAPLVLVVDGVDTETVTAAALLAGTTIPAPEGTVRWRLGTGPGAVLSSSFSVVAPALGGWRLGPNSRLENTEGLPAVTQGTVAVGSFIVGTVGAMQRITFRGTTNSVHISSAGLVSFVTEPSRLNDNALGRPVVPGERINFAWRVDSAGMGVRVEGEDGVVRSGGVGGVVLPASTGTYRIGSHDNGGQQFDGTMLALHIWEDPLFLPPTGTDIATMLDEFFQPDGTPKARADLGPEYAKYGDGTEGLIFSAVGSLDVDGSGNVIHGGGAPFSLVGTVENLSGSSGGGEVPTGFTITTDSDASLLDGTAANYTLSDADVLALGETEVDYSGWYIQLDRSSIVLGEGLWLEVVGPTEEQKATYGFIWEFETSGEFQYVPDLPWHMRQKNRATGHMQYCAWSDGDGSGDRAVRVKIIPPVRTGRKGVVLTATVPNRDPEVEFAGRTWVVDPTGTGDGAPAGATVVTTYNAALNGVRTVENDTRGGRILLRRGQVYALESAAAGPPWDWSQTWSGLCIGAWGPSEDGHAELDIRGRGFNWTARPVNVPYVLVRDIEFFGGYDVVSGINAESHTAFHVCESAWFTFNNCKFRNMEVAVKTINADELVDEQFGFWDCHITDWEDYGIWITRSQRVFARGSYIAQNPLAPSLLDWPNEETSGGGANGKKVDSGPVNHPQHGSIRSADSRSSALIVSQCQLRTMHGWSTSSQSTDGSGVSIRAQQPTLRIFTTKVDDGFNVLINDNHSEGGGYLVGGGSANGVVGSGFGSIFGNYHMANAGYCKWSISSGGLWVHDNIIVIPNSPREDVNKDTWGGFSYPGPTSSSSDPTYADQDIFIFNNTVAWMLESDNLFSGSGGGGGGGLSGTGIPGADAEYTDIMKDGSHVSETAPDVTLVNTLFWSPNITFIGEAGPRVPDGVRSAGLFGPTPTYRGRYFGPHGTETVEGLILNTYSATPANARIMPVLSSASSESLDDPDLQGALDFLGRIVPVDTVPGAVKPQVLKTA